MQLKRINNLFKETRQRFERSRSYITRDGQLNESYASTMELRNLNNLKNDMVQHQVKGRVVLNFLQKNFPVTEDNLTLENSDKLIIQQKMTSVMVMGHVYSPNAFVWREKYTVKDYLKKSGGYREEAGEEEVYIVLASGEVQSAKQIGHSKLMSFVPGPGDCILVPKQELERNGLAIAGDYLNLLRRAAEVGAIANSIPNAGPAQIGINSDTSNRNVQRGSYEELLK